MSKITQTKSDRKSIEELPALLQRMDMKSLLALQVLLSQQAISVFLTNEQKELKKSAILLPNTEIIT